MSTYRDNLGGFVIPSHLLDKIENYTPPEEKIDVISSKSEYMDWVLVNNIPGSLPGVMHKIERRGDEYRCSCQSFKFGKKGYCKHTIAVKKELDDLPF